MVSPLARKTLRDLGQMWAQVLTMALVVAAGVSVLIASLGAYRSLRDARDRFYRESRFADAFTFFKRAPRTLLDELNTIDGVTFSEGRIVYEAPLELAGGEPAMGRFVSLPDQGSLVLNRVYVRRGRLPESYRADEVFVNETFAEANALNPGDSVTAILNGRRREFRIVGTGLSPEFVYAFGAQSPLPDFKHNAICWIPESVLAAAVDMEGAINSAVFTLSHGGSERTVLRRIDETTEAYGGLDSFGRDRQTSNMFLRDDINQMRALAIMIPGIFLGVAAFLLHVVINRLVARQRGQVATLKALGYRNGSIAVHYLVLVNVIALAGALPAIATGIWMGGAMTGLYRIYYRFPVLEYETTLPLVIGGLLSAVAAATGGALLAVRRAVTLAPAEAMRPPSPPVFRRGLLEVLLERLPLVTRMMIRNLTRKPISAALGVIGIAFSVQILVIGFFWDDAMDYMMQMQFRYVQREDLIVNFENPVPRRALSEIQAEQGVIYAEGYRTVPVRLRFAHRHKDAVFQAFPFDARLRRIIDDQGRRVQLPPAGLLLGRRLAEQLGIRPGQELEVELLEADRRRFVIALTGTVQELLGSGAYMDLGDLMQVLGEQTAFTSVALSAEANQMDRIERELIQRPRVASVTPRDRAISTFEQTSSELITIYAAILVGFAGVIAFGVIYNTAMVSLSERAWELGSLRVLGFTRQEVFWMLTGELILQMIPGLPLGCLFGYGLAYLSLQSIEVEGFDIPLIIEPASFMYAMLIVVVAGIFSAFAIRRKINRLDMLSTLKVRE